MNTEKFTQGEWCLRTIDQFAEYGNPTRHIFVKDQHGKLGKSIATVSKSENDVANAYLVAAAPDMYRLLKKQCDICKLKDHETECEFCEIHKVLKKARGEWL